MNDAAVAHTKEFPNAIHPVWATFIDPALEAQYRASKLAANIRQAHTSTTALLVIHVLAVFLLDAQVCLPLHPEVFIRHLFIRVLVMAVLAGCIAATYMMSSPHFLSICAAVALGSAFLGLCAVSVVQYSKLGHVYNDITFIVIPVFVFLSYPLPLKEITLLMLGIFASAIIMHLFILDAEFENRIRIDIMMFVFSVFFFIYTGHVNKVRRREFTSVCALESAMDQLRSEIELRKASESILEEQSRELNVSLQDLELANRAKGRFLASMSHELRTPMNAVLGFAGLLQTQSFGQLNEKQREYVEHIMSSGYHLLELINEVLDIAKIDAGGAELTCIELPVKEALDDAIQSMTTQFTAKRLTVMVEPVPPHWAFLADKRRTKQIMLNLLSNAVKYTPEGGRIDIDVRNTIQGYYTTTVRDTGIGIAPEHQRRIFSEFEQAERARDEALGGIGLGLALTRRLVQMHGGEIGVDSVLGRGSAFWFTLPAVAPREAAGYKSDSGEARQFSIPPSRILIVEDNEINRLLLREILSVQGHEIHEATNGAQAVEIAISHNLDLVLMDIQMPVMNGLDATRAILANETCKGLPVIAITASVDPDRVSECLHAGCVGVLGKPINTTGLNELLEKHLSRET
jgi:signal transduction histidine kinase/ActR/RegA family two-component response regulator